MRRNHTVTNSVTVTNTATVINTVATMVTRVVAVVVAATMVSVLLSGVTPVGRARAACWLAPVVAPISDPYRAPVCPWCAGNRGVEYTTRPGTAVRAVAAGRVTFADTVVDRRYVVVEHGDGRRATYGHLASIAVRVGDRVVARSIVGTAGATMHFGLRDGDRYLDPTREIGRPAYPIRLVPLDGSPGAPPGPPRPRCDRVEKAGFANVNAPWRR